MQTRMSRDSVISNQLVAIQGQLDHIQQTLIEIQRELRQRTDTESIVPPRVVTRSCSTLARNVQSRSRQARKPDSPHDTSSETAGNTDSNRRPDNVRTGKSKRRIDIASSAAQDLSRPGVSRPSHQENQSVIAERVPIEDLFSDSNMPSPQKKGVSKKPPTDELSEVKSPPRKKRKLVKGARPPEIPAEVLVQSSDAEDESSPPPKLRRLIKGVRPYQQSEQPKNSSATTGEDNTSVDPTTDHAEPVKPKGHEHVEVELPVEFSRAASEPLHFQFKIVCQLFVVLALVLPEERQATMETALKENYFLVAMGKMRGALSGLRDSLVRSQVWRPDIAHALEMYPILEMTVLEVQLDGCEACHLADRVSSHKAILSGKAYNKLGFEPSSAEPGEVDSSDEGDSDSGSSEQEDSSDNEGDAQFNVGRFCARRAEVFHELTHWEIALFKSLLEEVDDRPIHLTNSDDIEKWLIGRGIIEEEWQKIKELMERSRNLEVDGKKDESCINYG